MLQAQAADNLVATAVRARQSAYAPYSHYAVGAAVMCADGRIFSGCNIENVSFSATVCAERVAMFTARAAGCSDIVAIAVVGPGCEPVTPCGVCRQVMSELAPRAVVIMQGEDGPRSTTTVAELLPGAFRPAELTGRSES